MGSTNFLWLVWGIKPEYSVRHPPLLYFYEWEVLEGMELQKIFVSYRKMDERMEHLFHNCAEQKLPTSTDCYQKEEYKVLRIKIKKKGERWQKRKYFSLEIIRNH